MLKGHETEGPYTSCVMLRKSSKGSQGVAVGGRLEIEVKSAGGLRKDVWQER